MTGMQAIVKEFHDHEKGAVFMRSIGLSSHHDRRDEHPLCVMYLIPTRLH